MPEEHAAALGDLLKYLDVVRGIYQTCSLVGVDFRAYLRHVLIARPEDVAANPDAFTPLAFSRLPKN